MKSFQREIFIPFHLVDAAGILFFGHVFTLAHQVFEFYVIEELKIPWRQWFQNEEWTVPIKQTDASYHKPLLAGHPCLIKVQIKDLRPSSFQVGYQFYQHEFECCQVSSIHVFCDRSTGAKREIPRPIHLLLEALKP